MVVETSAYFQCLLGFVTCAICYSCGRQAPQAAPMLSSVAGSSPERSAADQAAAPMGCAVASKLGSGSGEVTMSGRPGISFLKVACQFLALVPAQSFLDEGYQRERCGEAAVV